MSCPLLPPASGHAEGIDTEHIHGFVIGTDVGEFGEREFRSETRPVPAKLRAAWFRNW